MTVRETVDQQSAWGSNRTKDWLLGTSKEHCCYQAYIPSTRGVHIVLTVDFHTVTTKLPHISPAEAATYAAHNLTEALQNLSPNAPFAPVGNKKLTAIKELAAIFQKATTPVPIQTLKELQVSLSVEVAPNKQHEWHMPPRVKKAAGIS
eukprot:7020934-Ditylum_brightwellii.AAC.1